MRVAIIGAGAGGLTAAKALLEVGLTPVVYEASGDVGGLWVYRPQGSGLATGPYRLVFPPDHPTLPFIGVCRIGPAHMTGNVFGYMSSGTLPAFVLHSRTSGTAHPPRSDAGDREAHTVPGHELISGRSLSSPGRGAGFLSADHKHPAHLSAAGVPHQRVNRRAQPSKMCSGGGPSNG